MVTEITKFPKMSIYYQKCHDAFQKQKMKEVLSRETGGFSRGAASREEDLVVDSREMRADSPTLDQLTIPETQKCR